MTTASQLKYPLLSFQAPLTWASNGCLRVSPYSASWTQSIELRQTIGCRSRKLCWGNVCVSDWTASWACVNWAPRNHTQTRMISVCSPGSGGWDYPLTWMFHFENEIEIDFCLLSTHSDRHRNRPDSPGSTQSHRVRYSVKRGSTNGSVGGKVLTEAF